MEETVYASTQKESFQKKAGGRDYIHGIHISTSKALDKLDSTVQCSLHAGHYSEVSTLAKVDSLKFEQDLHQLILIL